MSYHPPYSYYTALPTTQTTTTHATATTSSSSSSLPSLPTPKSHLESLISSHESQQQPSQSRPQPSAPTIPSIQASDRFSFSYPHDSSSQYPLSVQAQRPTALHSILDDQQQPTTRAKNSSPQQYKSPKTHGRRHSRQWDLPSSKLEYQPILPPPPPQSQEMPPVEVMWEREDIESLRELLEIGERAKWKYISQELTKERAKRITAVACQKKFKDMFGVAEASSVLGSSLCYVVSPSGWSSLEDSKPLIPSSMPGPTSAGNPQDAYSQIGSSQMLLSDDQLHLSP